MFIDSHCHLDPETWGGDAAVDAVVQRATESGVGTLVTIGAGYGFACAPRAVAVAERHANVWCSVGVHPHDASEWGPDAISTLRRLAAHQKCLALGEMGLDFYYDNSPRDVQRRCLREQCRLALELQLPIIVHDRDSDGETFDVLFEEGAFDGAGVLWHCFTGDVPYMQRIVAAGGLISIPGIVTFKRAEPMRAVARAVPLDRVLIETDSPFLTPEPHRGTKNEPMRVVHVAEKLAELRGLTVEHIAAATSANARSFYRMPQT